MPTISRLLWGLNALIRPTKYYKYYLETRGLKLSFDLINLETLVFFNSFISFWKMELQLQKKYM